VPAAAAFLNTTFSHSSHKSLRLTGASVLWTTPYSTAATGV
jgi:hypothetical protein